MQLESEKKSPSFSTKNETFGFLFAKIRPEKSKLMTENCATFKNVDKELRKSFTFLRILHFVAIRKRLFWVVKQYIASLSPSLPAARFFSFIAGDQDH